MKKIIYILLAIFANISYSLASLKDDMSIKDTNGVELVTDVEGDSIVSDLLKYTKETLTSFVLIVAIGAFLYVGFKLIVARGNQEEFKKALQHFIYTVVGIVLVGLAYAIVTIVAGLKF